MLSEENVLPISRLKKLFPKIIVTKLPVLKTNRICRIMTLCQRSQNVLYCKNIKCFKIAYDVLYHFTKRPKPAHNLPSQKNLKTNMIKIVLTVCVYMCIYICIRSCKKNVVPCCGA